MSGLGASEARADGGGLPELDAERFSGEPTGWLTVASRTALANNVVGLRLLDPAGGVLPSWEPGAHIDVVLPSGRLRTYSLCSDPADRRGYEIAVLAEAGGSGSAELSDPSIVGARVGFLGPRNHFPLVEAERYLFLAGGIGIAPLLSMVAAVDSAGRPWHLLYRGRREAAMAFLDRLAAYPEGAVECSVAERDARPDVGRRLAELPPGTAVYCCGPPGLIAATESNAWRVGSRMVHTERFRRPRVVPSTLGAGEIGFEVELARSGHTLYVPPERSVLSVLRDVLADVPSSCGSGGCGACETRVLAGRVDHRDRVLSAAAAAANDTMMVCVSRSAGGRLVLDR